jgi:hypothetical protein
MEWSYAKRAINLYYIEASVSTVVIRHFFAKKFFTSFGMNPSFLCPPTLLLINVVKGRLSFCR